MTLENRKRLLALLWIAAIAAVAVFTGIPRSMAWLSVVVLGIGPSILLLYVWRVQPQTITESIQEARR
jgi:hypothetical protein